MTLDIIQYLIEDFTINDVLPKTFIHQITKIPKLFGSLS